MFLDVEMPTFFRLDVQLADGSWIDDRFCDRRNFERQPDGSYVCVGIGSPVFLRCVERDDDVLVCVDGGGRRSRYRLVPMNSDGTLPGMPSISAMDFLPDDVRRRLEQRVRQDELGAGESEAGDS